VVLRDLATRQKQQQWPMDVHEQLVDAICLWQWIHPKLACLISADYMTKLDDMFAAGSLGKK